MKEMQAKDVVDKLEALTVKDDEVDQAFENDFGSRLRLAEGAQLIQKIGNQLHCCSLTIAKAQLIFHQFKRLENDIEPNTLGLAFACLNLSIKLCEEDVTLDEAIKVFYNVAQDLKNIPNPVRSDLSSEKLSDLKRKLIDVEYSVLRAMGFKLELQLAHGYVYKFLNQLHSLCDVSDAIMVLMSSTAAKVLSTYYLCDGCLNFNADEIAIACLQFIYLYCGPAVPSAKYLFKKELGSVDNKDRIGDIVDELIIVADLSTSLKPI